MMLMASRTAARSVRSPVLQLFFKLCFELCFELCLQLGFELCLERSLKSRFEPAFQVRKLRVEPGLESTLKFRELRIELRIPLFIPFFEAIDKKPVDKLGLLAELLFDGFIAHFSLERGHASRQRL